LLKYERDANAQLDAVEALESFQTNQTRDVFRDTILNSNFFYRVREQAAKSLAKVSDFIIYACTYMYMYMYVRTGIIIGVLPYHKRLI
jgi:type IV secretory pathway component VirB8